jgi:ABC-type arginine transport system permease subunit
MKAILTELVLNTVAVPIVGAPDMVVTAVDVPDETDVPLEFVAVTVNVYTVFDVKPDTVIGEEVVPVPVKPPGLLVTV